MDQIRKTELENAVRRYLVSAAVGPENAKTTDEIARGVGVPVTRENVEIRDAIRALVINLELPVCASVDGYFVATAPQQLNVCADSLERRAEKVLQRPRALRHMAAQWAEFSPK